MAGALGPWRRPVSTPLAPGSTEEIAHMLMALAQSRRRTTSELGLLEAVLGVVARDRAAAVGLTAHARTQSAWP